MTLTPATIALSWVQGARNRFTLQLWADAAQTIPFDLTGYAARSEVRNLPADYDESLVLTTPTVTVLDATNGLIEFDSPASESSAISSLVYPRLYSSVEIYTSGDADVQRPLNIRFNNRPREGETVRP